MDRFFKRYSRAIGLHFSYRTTNVDANATFFELMYQI